MNDLNDWIGNLRENAEKEKLRETVTKRVKENEAYKSEVELIYKQLALLDEKRKELVREKDNVFIKFANMYLKEMGSKYRMKIGTQGDYFKDVWMP